MKKNLYLVALFCGALCLTGCLKNEESASVTQVRFAKANELNSIAALNNAKAQAETVLAEANAAFIEAQAQVEAAKAAKLAAETEYQLISNKIHEIDIQLKQLEVELAGVNLQKAQTELLKAQAELDQKLAEVEAAKKAAEYQLAYWADQMDQLAAQAEIDAVNAAKNLLAAQLAYAQQIEAVENAEVTYITGIITKFTNTQTDIVNLQKQILDEQVLLEKAKAGILNPEEVYAEKIAKNAAMLKYYKALYDKYASFASDVDFETYQGLLGDAITALIDAQNVFTDLKDLEVEAQNAKIAANTELQNASFYYKELTTATSDFQTKAKGIAAITVDPVTKEWKYKAKAGTDDEEEIVLFVPGNDNKDTLYTFVPKLNYEELEAKGLDKQFYIDEAKNAFNAFVADPLNEAPIQFAIYAEKNIVPASVKAENWTVVFDEVLAAAQETRDKKINGWDEETANGTKHHNSYAEDRAIAGEAKEKDIAEYEAEKEAKEAFIASLQAKYDAVDIDALTKAKDEAEVVMQDAAKALKNAHIAGAADVEEAWKAYKDAESAYNTAKSTSDSKKTALDNAKKAVIDFKKAVVNAIDAPTTPTVWWNTSTTPNVDFFWGVPATDPKHIQKYYNAWKAINGAPVKDAEYEAAYVAAIGFGYEIVSIWNQETVKYQSNQTSPYAPYQALVTYYETKANDYKLAVEALAAAEKEVDLLYLSMIEAQAAYLADPTTANETAWNEAKLAYNTAAASVKPTGSKALAVTNAEKALTVGTYSSAWPGKTAAQAYADIWGDKTKKDYKGDLFTADGEAVAAQKFAQVMSKSLSDNETALKAKVDAVGDDTKGATKAYNDAKKKTDTAKSTMDSKKSAWQTKYDAIDKNSDAGKAYKAAKDAYDKADAAVTKAGTDKAKLDETYKYDGVNAYEGTGKTATYDAIKAELALNDDGTAKNAGVVKNLQQAQAELEAIYDTYDNATTGLIALAEKALNDVKETVKEAQEVIDHMVASEAGYVELVKSFNEAVDAYALAREAAALAEFQMSTKKAEYLAISADDDVVDENGAAIGHVFGVWKGGVRENISLEEYDALTPAEKTAYTLGKATNYAYEQFKIEKAAKKAMKDAIASNLTNEKAKLTCENNIANWQKKIDALKVLAAQYQAIIDAWVAENSSSAE